MTAFLFGSCYFVRNIAPFRSGRNEAGGSGIIAGICEILCSLRSERGDGREVDDGRSVGNQQDQIEFSDLIQVQFGNIERILAAIVETVTGCQRWSAIQAWEMI